MPQTWLVVQCYQCKTFQVDQEKKAKKWQCKLCGEKQSLQRIFARSHSAKVGAARQSAGHRPDGCEAWCSAEAAEAAKCSNSAA